MWNDYVFQHLFQQHVRELHAAADRRRLADLAARLELEPARTPRHGWLHFPSLHPLQRSFG